MDNDQLYEMGYDAGMKIASVVRGFNGSDAYTIEAANDTLLQDVHIQNMISKAAAVVLELGGEENSLHHRLFVKLAKATSPVSEVSVDRFITPVIEAFTEHGQRIREEGLSKQANKAAALFSLFGGSLRNLFLASLAVGGGAGTLGWLANRSATQDDADVEALEAQAQHYRNIAKDIKKRVKLEDEEDKRKAILDAGEAQYVL